MNTIYIIAVSTVSAGTHIKYYTLIHSPSPASILQKVLGIVLGNGCELRALTPWACRHCRVVTKSFIRDLNSKLLQRTCKKKQAFLGAKVLGIEKWVNP